VVHCHDEQTSTRITTFNWDDSLIRMLSNQPTHIRKEALGLEGTGDKWTCRAVGIKEPQDRTTVGAAIHANLELVERLQQLLYIEKHRDFLPVPPESKKEPRENGIH